MRNFSTTLNSFRCLYEALQGGGSILDYINFSFPDRVPYYEHPSPSAGDSTAARHLINSNFFDIDPM